MIDYKELRENIDSLIDEIKSFIKQKSILESTKRIEKANKLLTQLKEMSEGEIQNRIVLKRIYQLESLAKNVDEILSKRELGKKEDGNIALKCNWNDKHYKAPCSLQAYNYNLLQGRAWCSSPLCKCREFTNEVSLQYHPCYESIALKEMYFGAGWDHTGERQQPRHIHSVRHGRMAILTTRPPGADEKDRLIIGCLFIKSVIDDPGEETKIFGDKTKSIEIDYDQVKVKFWDYYKNAGDDNLILWASGLFRYITDETVLNILKGIGEQYKNAQKDVSKIIELIKYYEEQIKRKK
ncbi:MAG: hypothetical protein HS132_10865 [Planctomycetia bacterium]|nr:hypothetical protein [Planctomycetia bacterium]